MSESWENCGKDIQTDGQTDGWKNGQSWAGGQNNLGEKNKTKICK